MDLTLVARPKNRLAQDFKMRGWRTLYHPRNGGLQGSRTPKGWKEIHEIIFTQPFSYYYLVD